MGKGTCLLQQINKLMKIELVMGRKRERESERGVWNISDNYNTWNLFAFWLKL